MPGIKYEDVELGAVYEVLIGGRVEQVTILAELDPRLKRGGRGRGWKGQVERTGAPVTIASAAKLRRLVREPATVATQVEKVIALSPAQRALADRNRLWEVRSRLLAGLVRNAALQLHASPVVAAFAKRHGERLEANLGAVAESLMGSGRRLTTATPREDAFEAAIMTIEQAADGMQQREQKQQLQAHLQSGAPKRTLAYAFSPAYHDVIAVLRRLSAGTISPEKAVNELGPLQGQEAATPTRGYVLNDWLRELGATRPDELVEMAGYVTPDKIFASALDVAPFEQGLIERVTREMLVRSHEPVEAGQILEEAAYLDEQRGTEVALPAALAALDGKPPSFVADTLKALKARAPEILPLVQRPRSGH